MGHKQSLLLLSGKLLPADFAMSSGATFASALALSRVPQVKATLLFCPAVWKRFRGNRDRQVGGRRTGRNCFQNFRSKEREDRQPLHVPSAQAFSRGNLREAFCLSRFHRLTPSGCSSNRVEKVFAPESINAAVVCLILCLGQAQQTRTRSCRRGSRRAFRSRV